MALDLSMSELDGGPVEYAPSIWAALQGAFNRNAKRNAVISLHQDPDHLCSLVGETTPRPKYLTWTFEQLLHGAVVVAAALAEAGIKTGDTVVTLIPNGADHCLLRMAAIVAKLNFTALDLGMTTTARALELQGMLTLLEPAVVVVVNAAAAKAVDAALAATGIRPLLKLDAHWEKTTVLYDGWTDLNQMGRGRPVDTTKHDKILEEALVDDHDRVCAILFTSGTSMGKPKGCPRTVLNTIHTLFVCPQRISGLWTVRLVDTANFRAICNVVAASTWADDGTFVVSSASPSPASMLQAMEEVKVTDTFMLPAIVRLIEALPAYSKDKVKSITTIGVGGDVVTKSMLELTERVFPNCRSVNAHGSSEATKIFDWSFYNLPPRYFGEVPALGHVWPGVRIKVVDDNDNIVARGTPGEMHISSAAVIPHYLGGVNKDSFYKDGTRQWFNTGDTAVVDNDGFTYIIGRSKDIIKRIGVPITPGAIETCLAAYADAVVVVVDVFHEEYGAEPFAIMSDYGDKSIDQLKARVIEMLGPDYALGGVVLLQYLGFHAWPLNATDKVNKVALKAALKSYLGIS